MINTKSKRVILKKEIDPDGYTWYRIYIDKKYITGETQLPIAMIIFNKIVKSGKFSVRKTILKTALIKSKKK